MRFLAAAGVAYFVFAGLILAHFNQGAMPAGFLIRPLLVAAGLAAAIAGVSLLTRRYTVLVAAGFAGAVSVSGAELLLVLASVGALALITRMMGRHESAATVIALAAAVFCVSGLVAAVPNMSLRIDGPTQESKPTAGPPVYLVLLDGYPRLDSLAEIGIDGSDFVQALEQRGFNYYADAQSEFAWTHLTLSVMTGNDVTSGDDFGSLAERRKIRAGLRLPDGFVTISPPIGHVVIPGVRNIGPAGTTDFEVDLLGRSVLGALVRNWLADDLRRQLDESLDTLANTEERRVFAHLLSPHRPFLFDADGTPTRTTCWPDCHMFNVVTERMGITIHEWTEGTRGNLEYLNERILESIDSIVARRPDAVIVLFSDHGGRYSVHRLDEWHRTFLAARTPGEPGLFTYNQDPSAVLEVVQNEYLLPGGRSIPALPRK